MESGMTEYTVHFQRIDHFEGLLLVLDY